AFHFRLLRPFVQLLFLRILLLLVDLIEPLKGARQKRALRIAPDERLEFLVRFVVSLENDQSFGKSERCAEAERIGQPLTILKDLLKAAPRGIRVAFGEED